MMNEQSATTSLKRYTLDDAVNCIAYYKARAMRKGLEIDTLIKAYLVRTIDIFEALGLEPTRNMENIHTRVYIGMEDTGSEADHIYKLFLVPVEDDGNTDIIPVGPVVEGGPDVPFVYDFNMPCPKTCDENSPLYLAGTRNK